MNKKNTLKSNEQVAQNEMLEQTQQKKEQKFSKSSIVNSAKYINKRDALNTILSDEKEYSLNEVNKILEKFYKQEVK